MSTVLVTSHLLRTVRTSSVFAIKITHSRIPRWKNPRLIPETSAKTPHRFYGTHFICVREGELIGPEFIDSILVAALTGHEGTDNVRYERHSSMRSTGCKMVVTEWQFAASLRILIRLICPNNFILFNVPSGLPPIDSPYVRWLYPHSLCTRSTFFSRRHLVLQERRKE